MAWRLEHDESVIAGVKRLARDQMDSGERRLSAEKDTSRDQAIHEARKSVKKVRALMRLVRGELGSTYTAENARLRDIGRRLSEFRDAFAIVETFDDLANRCKDEAGEKFQPIRDALVKQREESEREEDVGLVVAEAAQALKKASARVKFWPLRTDGFAGLAPGLKRTFRAGRKALARVKREPRPENYHELRKRVKDHWYHIRLLEPVWTDAMSGYEKSLNDLETALGNDHNLTVLGDKIAAEPARYGNPAQLESFFDLLDKYQKELRDHSLAIAGRVYEEKPGELVRRLEPLWNAWRHEPEHVNKSPTAA